MRKAVVIMFHCVGLSEHRWCYPAISDSLEGFEEKMEALARRGYASIFFKDHDPGALYHRKTVCVTFDDGYLDNWIHVFPILKRYGLKGTIFVNPEFVDPREILRPQVEPGAVKDAAHTASSCCAGFLSWPEMRAMEKSGLVDIQSHALTHTWYPSGPRIVDFWHPGSATKVMGCAWMLWNAYPEFKPFYLTEAGSYESRIPYGTPVYEHGKALVTRQYLPDRSVEQRLAEYVASRGGARFFERHDWKEELRQVAEKHPPAAGPERYESHEAYLGRVRNELRLSRHILERQLEKRIEAICWPGGGVSPEVLALAREEGYRRFTLPSAWRAAQAAGAFADLCPRMGTSRRIYYGTRDLGPFSGKDFICAVERARGSVLHLWLGRGRLLTKLLTSCVKR